MVRCVVSAVCVLSLFILPVVAQTIALEPLRYDSGAVLDFHLQTRFNPGLENETDLLPKGTLLRVKLLSTVDSDTARDGSEIRGVVTEALLSGDKVVVHSAAEACVLFVVLRSRTHPQGFRYELLVTKVIDHGKALDLTASLGTSFDDASSTPRSDAKPAAVPAVRSGAPAAIAGTSSKKCELTTPQFREDGPFGVASPSKGPALPWETTAPRER